MRADKRETFRLIKQASLLCLLLFLLHLPGFAQSTAYNLAPLTVSTSPLLPNDSLLLSAVSRPDPSIIPTDQTPTRIGDERALVAPRLKLKVLEALPARMYFSSVTEVSQRFESNVFNNARNPNREYAFRVLPNCTLGYQLLPRTNVYANYFMIKDVFADAPLLNKSTFHSVSGGVQHDVPLDSKSNLQLNFQVRQLYQAVNLHQADLLPGITYTRILAPGAIGFFNTQLQLRSRDLFLGGGTREIDPFYTVGLVFRKGKWTLASTGTLVNNFRNRSAIPSISNNSIICAFDLARPVASRRLPGLDAFVRAEPIWNWGANSAPGLSGFDFRLFSGLRYSIAKPAIYGQMVYLRKQLKEAAKNRTH